MHPCMLQRTKPGSVTICLNGEGTGRVGLMFSTANGAEKDRLAHHDPCFKKELEGN